MRAFEEIHSTAVPRLFVKRQRYHTKRINQPRKQELRAAAEMRLNCQCSVGEGEEEDSMKP